MKAAGGDLRRVQQWMQRFIVDPRADALVHRSRAREAARLVRPSTTLSAVERVAIYRGMYLLRMEEALASDFPALKHHLGEARFARLVAGYVEAHPSRSYTLSRLRDRLPGYLRRAPGIRARGFATDLARLELAMCEVFDEEESAALSPAEAARISVKLGAASRIGTIRALRLLELRWPANEFLQAFREGRRRPPLRRRKGWLAVYRRDGMVWRLGLSRPAFRVLESLRRGVTLGRALRSAGAGRGAREEEIFLAFRRCASEGLIASIR